MFQILILLASVRHTAACNRTAYQKCNLIDSTVATGCTTAGMSTEYAGILACATASGCLNDLATVTLVHLAPGCALVSSLRPSHQRLVQLIQHKTLCGGAALMDPKNATVVTAPSHRGPTSPHYDLVANIGVLVCCILDLPLLCFFVVR
jgi:hypothetical protein